MTIQPPYFPTPELVAVAYFGLYVPELESGAIIASSLPAPASDGTLGWRTSGFVTVRAIDPAASQVDLPVRSSYLKLDGWGAPATAGSNKPQWNLAAGLIEAIRWRLDSDRQTFGKPVTITKPNYRGARVLSSYSTSEPRRVENDPNAYARVTFDVMLDWATL